MQRGGERYCVDSGYAISMRCVHEQLKLGRDLYGIVKRRLGFEEVAMLLLFFQVAAEVFVVVAAVVFGRIGVVCEEVMQEGCGHRCEADDREEE